MDDPAKTDLAAILAKLDEVLRAVSAPPPRFLTVEEAAGYCSVSPRSIRAMVEAGKLTALYPVPGSMRLDRLEIDKVVAGSTKAPRGGRGQYPRRRNGETVGHAVDDVVGSLADTVDFDGPARERKAQLARWILETLNDRDMKPALPEAIAVAVVDGGLPVGEVEAAVRAALGRDRNGREIEGRGAYINKRLQAACRRHGCELWPDRG